jgi:hypothetical protein
MKENLILLLQIITVDFFTAFGLYSLFFLIASIFFKKSFLFKVDEEAKKFISFVGIIYFIIWIIGIIVFYAESNLEEQNSMLNRIFGKYWFGFWLQPIVWFLITQLLRIKRVAKNVFLRIIFSFLLIISFEKYVIIITSFHRDYLPSTWTMYNDLEIYPSNLFLALLVKIIMFLLFVGIYYSITNKFKKKNCKKEL